MNKKIIISILLLLLAVAIFFGLKKTGVFEKTTVDLSKTDISSDKMVKQDKADNISIEKDDLALTKEYFNDNIQPDLSGVSGNNSLIFIDLKNKANKVSYNSKQQKSASLIKLFVMAYAYDQISKGQLKKADVYEHIFSMITVDDNAATDILIDKLGMNKIDTYIKNIGMKDTKLQRKMLDKNAIKQGKENYTSVCDVAYLLEKMYTDSLVPRYGNEMLNIMSKQTKRSKIPAQISQEGTKIYNKTGEDAEYNVENDIAIIKNANGAYILCMMCSAGNSVDQVSLIANTSGKIYIFYNSQLFDAKKRLEKSNKNAKKDIEIKDKVKNKISKADNFVSL